VPPLIWKLNGSPINWVLFEAACLQTLSSAPGMTLVYVTTVSVPPAGALTTAVPVPSVLDTRRAFGVVRIDATTVDPPCASTTVTSPPATNSWLLQPPPTTLTDPPAPVWSVYVKEKDRPVMPFADDLQISMEPGRAAACAGS
jgi:hypothetical protein